MSPVIRFFYHSLYNNHRILIWIIVEMLPDTMLVNEAIIKRMLYEEIIF